MIAGLLVAGVLVLALLVARSRTDVDAAASDAWSHTASRPHIVGGACLVLAAHVPLVALGPWAAPWFWGDDGSHARVAADLAAGGLGRLWADSYLGGFPVGPHYPILGWLLLAVPIGAGVPAVTATNTLGLLAVLAAPFGVYAAALHAGARPLVAAFGACLVSAVSPYTPFVGGYEAYYRLGLVSQVVAVPACIAMAAVVIRSRSPFPIVLASGSAMAAHPQLTLAALAVLTIATVAAWRLGPALRLLRAGCAAGLTGVALYAYGSATLKVPFGWPPDIGWRRVGFPPERLWWWLIDGDLLDRDRAPVLTAIVAASMLGLLLRAKRPAARALLAAALATVGLSVAGPGLARLGVVGEGAVALVQPLRVVAMLPLVAAAIVIAAAEEAAPLLRRLGPRPWVFWATATIGWAVLGSAVPARLAWARKHVDAIAQLVAASPCGAEGSAERQALRGWLGHLTGGRILVASGEWREFAHCEIHAGVDLMPNVPYTGTGAVGSHVGTHWVAFGKVAPERAGSSRRAEALGIRYLLRRSGEPAPGWHRIARGPVLELLALDGSASPLVATGCIERTWTGSDAALRARLEAELATPEGADRLLDPAHFTALVEGTGDVRVAPHAAASDCNAAGASATLTHYSAGRVQVEVHATHPVDLVVRNTAYPSWTARLDGARVDIARVAPGFMAVRVPGGQHHVSLETSLPWAQLALAVLGSAGLAVLAWATLSHHERSP